MRHRFFICLTLPSLLFTFMFPPDCRAAEESEPSPDQAAEIRLLNDQSARLIANLKAETNSPAASETNAAQRTEEAAPTAANRIMPGDDLLVQVWMRDKITQFAGFPLRHTVPESGQLFVPNMGLTDVAGRTDAELATLLAGYFSKILAEPTVVVEHRSRMTATEERRVVSTKTDQGKTIVSETISRPVVPDRVTIMGWIGSPNVYPLQPGWRIRDLVATAGGIKDFGRRKAVLLVRGEIENPQVLKINVQDILYGKDLKQNLLLEPNDAIYVPPVATWYSYDFIRVVLLPVTAVRDAVWIGGVVGVR